MQSMQYRRPWRYGQEPWVQQFPGEQHAAPGPLGRTETPCLSVPSCLDWINCTNNSMGSASDERKIKDWSAKSTRILCRRSLYVPWLPSAFLLLRREIGLVLHDCPARTNKHRLKSMLAMLATGPYASVGKAIGERGGESLTKHVDYLTCSSSHARLSPCL